MLRVKKNQISSFTIIELVVVVAMISAVVGALLPSYISFVNYQKKSETQSKLENIRSALIHYFEDRTIFPTSLTYLYYPDGSPKWNGPYIDTLPSAATKDAYLNYFVYPTPYTYRAVVISRGKDGIDQSSALWISDPDNFSPQGDDIAIVSEGVRREFSKLLVTLSKLEELARLLEEYFDKKCQEGITTTYPSYLSDPPTYTYNVTNIRSPVMNYFPQYLTQILPQSYLYSAWDEPIYYQGCATEFPSSGSDESNWNTCDDYDPPDDPGDPAFEARLTTYHLGITYERVAVGFCRPDVKEEPFDSNITSSVLILDHSQSTAPLKPVGSANMFLPGDLGVSVSVIFQHAKYYSAVITSPYNCRGLTGQGNKISIGTGVYPSTGAVGCFCALPKGRIRGGTYVDIY